MDGGGSVSKVVGAGAGIIRWCSIETLQLHIQQHREMASEMFVLYGNICYSLRLGFAVVFFASCIDVSTNYEYQQ